MQKFLKVIVVFSFLGSFAQGVKKDTLKIPIDSLYREDQFYINISYNSLLNKPQGFSQNKFSPGFAFGFLRDMPLNKKRTFSFALGLGYASSTYNETMYIYKGTDINGNENPTKLVKVLLISEACESLSLSHRYLCLAK